MSDDVLDEEIERFEREALAQLLSPGGPRSRRAGVSGEDVEIWQEDSGWFRLADLDLDDEADESPGH